MPRAPRSGYGLHDLAEAIEIGASPRGPIGLCAGPRRRSPVVRGRELRASVDVHDLALDVLRHRIVLTYEAHADGVQADDLIRTGARCRRSPCGGRAAAPELPRGEPPAPRAAAGPAGPGTDARSAVAALDLALVRKTAGRLPGDHPGRRRGAGAPSLRRCARTWWATTSVTPIPRQAPAPASCTCAQQVPERALTNWLLLMCRVDAFGTADRLKSDVAEGLRRCLPGSPRAAADASVWCGWGAMAAR